MCVYFMDMIYSEQSLQSCSLKDILDTMAAWSSFLTPKDTTNTQQKINPKGGGGRGVLPAASGLPEI